MERKRGEEAKKGGREESGRKMVEKEEKDAPNSQFGAGLFFSKTERDRESGPRVGAREMEAGTKRAEV